MSTWTLDSSTMRDQREVLSTPSAFSFSAATTTTTTTTTTTIIFIIIIIIIIIQRRSHYI